MRAVQPARTKAPKPEWIHYVSTLILSLSCILTSAISAPRTPVDDQEILVTLAGTADYDTNKLRNLREQLKKQPENSSLAIQLATAYIQIARENTDIRYYGYARATLAPWWQQPAPPVEVLFLRAILHQHDHAFDAATQDLKTLLKQQPGHSQAWLTLSTIQQVQGNYSAARASCAALANTGASWLSQVCHSQILSLTGSAERAYQLQQVIARQADKQASLSQWIHGLSAETALRLGRYKQAEKHFKIALAYPLRDAYLLRIYSDYLIYRQRPREVLILLSKETRDDALLLRLAIAAKQAGEERLSKGFQQQLVARYNAVSLRGSKTHAKDNALFILHFGGAREKALRLALENWQQQKEPDDAFVLLRAAKANHSVKAIGTVRDWIEKNNLQDKRIDLMLRRL